ncbi:uncharacterized protein B0H18DRAFT_1080908 [Fomitopsis serialis]|uniref:uncharacterized protein n=1 Tax=Fomitopsis serialis TaxID=139415 RepID=UPI0020084BB7|nr:uncharacterized protein B0H18DRAFT_1080908 [Neoantrodia serialis]KAH9938110.1 hypothetical protein B0H18DRAFT_1080908 [Neoantrodia serialis]
MSSSRGLLACFLSRVLLLLCLCLIRVPSSYAQPAQLQYEDCYYQSNTSLKFDISTVYAQVLDEANSEGKYLNFTVLGETPKSVMKSSNPNGNSSGAVANWTATLFTVAEELTFQVWNNNSFFCSTLRPPTDLLGNTTEGGYCPFSPGPFAFSTTNLLFCMNLNTTLLDPGAMGSVYGHASIVFWVTVALAIGYWVAVGIARLVSAWGRGSTRMGTGLWARVESAGFILASAISGERLANSPALMRYCTPSLRDIIFHTQWCAALAMVAVEWPAFVYPLLAQTAWSTLTFSMGVLVERSTGSQSRWHPLTVQAYDPPSNFAAQLNNASSPLYIDADAPNVIFVLPDDATQASHLFGMCLVLFLAILAGTVALSMLDPNQRLTGSRSPRYSAGSKDLLEGVGQGADERSLNSHFLLRSTTFFPAGRRWWRLKSGFVTYHSNVLHGNLVRILIWFHLPVTIFSCYQMTLGRETASLGSIILAAISFAIFSVLLPIFLVVRLTLTNTTKLYDETWTLLSLGPLYNHYRHGSQLFARSGTAQAIIILVVEVASALGTSVWLPWGQGASMGLISFLFCVARIVIAVLLVILTPIVSVEAGAAQWIAYAILCILALIYLALLLMLIVKIVEGVIRIIGGVGFHRSKHVVDSGLLGTLGLLGCCGSRRPYQRRPQVAKQPSTIPLTKPSPPYRDATPTPSGPPSVLRPEHALQPYKEESDDETGFIMGAWQPFPGPGYSPVDDVPRSPEQSKSSSGFARVGGGRAHFESPYAIRPGSDQAFPSTERAERQAPSSSLAQSSTIEYSPPPTPGCQLPPCGRCTPAHIRTKSQTAIIEDASALANLRSQGAAAVPSEAVDTAEDSTPKKRWFNRRKSRRMSEGDLMSMSEPPAQDTGRSFVVVRKQRPGVPPRDGSSSSNPRVKGSQNENPLVFSADQDHRG